MTPYLQDPDLTLWCGDCLDVLRTMPSDSVDAVVTSPPYLDARPEYPSPTLEEFEQIFSELSRVTRGGMLLNVGRLWKNKEELLWWTDLLKTAHISGWSLSDTLVWIKPNANPIQGQILANSHEYVFLLGDPESFDPDAVRTEYAEGSEARLQRKWLKGVSVKGQNLEQPTVRDANPDGARARSYVAVYTGKEKGINHPAPMALDLAFHLIRLSGANVLLDPFAGVGTTGLAARQLGKKTVLIEQQESYCAEAKKRLSQLSLIADSLYLSPETDSLFCAYGEM